MFGLFQAEMVKQWRRPRTYVALGLAALVPIIVAVSLETNPPGAPGTPGGGGFGPRGGENDPLSYLATRTGLVLPVFVLEVMSGFLLVVLVALFGGDAVASEANWGNLRAMLARPIARGRFLGVKLTSALLLAFIVTLSAVVVGLVAGGLAFGWHRLDVPLLGLHQSTGETIANLGLATVYVFWGLAGVVALGFMVSTMTDAPAGAIFAAVGFYLVTRILDAITALGSLRDVLPTHYSEAWTDLFTKNGATNDMLTGALLQIPYLVVFCAVGWWWFGRKDILS